MKAFKQFCVFLAVVLSCILCFAFAGCADPDGELPLEMLTNPWEKRYDIVSTVEKKDLERNLIEDNLTEYEIHTLYDANQFPFGTTHIDVWRTYTLKERANGAYRISYTTSHLVTYAADPSNLDSIRYYDVYYDQSISVDIDGLRDKLLCPTIHAEVYAEDDVLAPKCYFTWYVEDDTVNNETQPATRTTTIRLYTLFLTSAKTITLNEYFFRETSRL